MTDMFDVTLTVQVTDETALRKAVGEKMADANVEDFDAESAPLAECIRLLYDPEQAKPGTEIHDSSCEPS